MLAMIASNRYVDFMFIMRTIGLVFVFVLCCFMVTPVDGAKLGYWSPHSLWPAERRGRA